MTLSARYAVPLAVVLAVALIPTTIHSYLGLRVDDGRRARDLEVRLDGNPGSETSRKADWVKRRLASQDWMERRYSAGTGEVVLFVGRSYDPKALYHHPELALAYGHDLESQGTVDIRGIPAYALVSRNGERFTALYALHANEAFVADPIRYQILSATSGLFRGREPMTLFFAFERGGEPRELSATMGARALEAAVTAFTKRR